MITQLSALDLTDKSTLALIEEQLASITAESIKYVSGLQKEDCHLYYSGEINDIDAISVCSTDLTNDEINDDLYINLNIGLVWVKEEYRGTNFAKEFVTDVGYSLGKSVAQKINPIAFQKYHLEAFAECRNQGGYNCCYWLSQLFAASFQLSNIKSEPLIRSFTTTFPGVEDPVPY